MCADEESQNSKADGVYFNKQANTWFPDAEMCQIPIPREFPDEAMPWALRRATCSDVQQSYNGSETYPYLTDDGYMIGKPCMPVPFDQRCSCGHLWKEATPHSDGLFVLRTYLGAVKREKYTLKCNCDEELKWDPGHEFIHTINSDTEGG